MKNLIKSILLIVIVLINTIVIYKIVSHILLSPLSSNDNDQIKTVQQYHIQKNQYLDELLYYQRLATNYQYKYNQISFKLKQLQQDLKYYYKIINDIIDYSTKYTKIYTINRLSCYTPSEDETDSTPHTTAINQKVIVGRTAAVSNDLSFMLGKFIYIRGYGVFEVTDVTHSRYRKTIDLCLSDSKEACNIFGVKKNIKVVILYDKSRIINK